MPEDDPDLIAADKAKRIAEAMKATAEADKAAVEATAALEAARRTAANADRDAAMAQAKAKADNDKAIAEAQKAASDAAAAVEVTKRAAANADRTAAMAEAKAKAENDKAIAEARSAGLKAMLPAPTTKPLEGKVTSGDGTGTVGRVAALTLLGAAASQIATNVNDAGADRVLIVDHVDLAASDWSHALVNSQLTKLTAAATRAGAAIEAAARPAAGAQRAASSPQSRFLPAAGAVATALPSLVGAVADVAGYFRSDYTVGKVDVTVTSTPLIAAVAAALITKKVTVHVDGFALFDRDRGTVASFGRMLDARWDLLDARLRAGQTLLQRAKDGVTEVQLNWDKAKASADASGPAEKAAEMARAAEAALDAARAKVAEAQGLIDAAAKVEELIDAQVTPLTTTDTGQTLPPLGRAALRDLLHDPAAGVHVLALTIDHLGSDAIGRRMLFVRARTTYVGAAHVSALLLAPGGEVAAAATIAHTSTTRLLLSSGQVEAVCTQPVAVVTAGATAKRLQASRVPIPPPSLPLPPPGQAAAGAQVAPGTARWTLLVYMAGMNNLYAEADADIAEIIAGQPGGEIEVVVFVKQPSGVRRFRVGGEEERLDNAVDSGDPNTVVDFVRWATTVAPAEHYALILWNHGSGWEPWAYDVEASVAVRPVRTVSGNVRKVNSSVFSTGLARHFPDVNARQRAILTDDGTAHAVDTIELGSAVTAIAEHLGGNLDVLAMDACLMSNLEVVCEVRDLVNVVVASEELEPPTGWHYTDLLQRLKERGDALDAEQFGRLAVESYIDGYKRSGEPVTMCAIATAGAAALAAAIDDLADHLMATLPEGRTLITDAIGDSVRFDGHLVDLGHLCTSLAARTVAAEPGSADADVQRAATEVLAKLQPDQGYVLVQDHIGDGLKAVQGVSIYLPARTDPLASTYAAIRFSKEGRWLQLIEAYRSAGTSPAPA